MKGMLMAILFALAAACGGSNSGSGGSTGTANPNNFLGTAWNGSVNTTVTCPGAPAQSQPNTYQVGFSQASDADFQYTSGSGCTYKFKVSGNTASLSNSPVSCSSTVSGVTVTATWTSYTLTTSDGHNLAISAAGNASASGTTCPFSQTGTATR